MAIERIGILMTAPELYDRQDTPTGDVFVDGVVSVLKERTCPSVAQIANLLGVDRTALSRVIELRVGLNLKDMVDYWRWRKVMYLLTETDKPFKDVAHDCGFSGYSTLYRFVLRKEGKTLVELRENRQRRHWKQNRGYV